MMLTNTLKSCIQQGTSLDCIWSLLHIGNVNCFTVYPPLQRTKRIEVVSVIHKKISAYTFFQFIPAADWYGIILNGIFLKGKCQGDLCSVLGNNTKGAHKIAGN